MAIYITEFMVSNDLSKIDLKMVVEQGETVDKLYLWNQDTYKDPEKVIDLTSKLSRSSNGEEIEIQRDIHWNCKEYVSILNEEEYNIEPKLEFFCYVIENKQMEE